jgi:trans-2-enoyl-CoA reductase
MRSDVQEKIAELWQAATTENLADLGFRRIEVIFIIFSDLDLMV